MVFFSSCEDNFFKFMIITKYVLGSWKKSKPKLQCVSYNMYKAAIFPNLGIGELLFDMLWNIVTIWILLWGKGKYFFKIVEQEHYVIHIKKDDHPVIFLENSLHLLGRRYLQKQKFCVLFYFLILREGYSTIVLLIVHAYIWDLFSSSVVPD